MSYHCVHLFDRTQSIIFATSFFCYVDNTVSPYIISRTNCPLGWAIIVFTSSTVLKPLFFASKNMCIHTCASTKTNTAFSTTAMHRQNRIASKLYFRLSRSVYYCSNISKFLFLVLHITSLFFHIIRIKDPHVALPSTRKRLLEASTTSEQVISTTISFFDISLLMIPL